jgi:hypothetical protein
VPILVAAIVVLIVMLSSGGAGSSIVARAYAATNSGGSILFYKTATYYPGVDKPNDYGARAHAAFSVWASGRAVHMSGTLIIGGQPGHPASPPLRHEVVLDGTNITTWDGGSPKDPSGVITKTSNYPGRGGCTELSALLSPLCGDPLTALRRLYRSGRLHAAGPTTYDGHKVDVLTGTAFGPPQTAPRSKPTPGPHVRVLVDAATSTPVEVQLTAGDGPTLTTTFSDFTRLPFTTANQKLLQMSPHPGACVMDVPAGRIVLRSGAKLPCQ